MKSQVTDWPSLYISYKRFITSVYEIPQNNKINNNNKQTIPLKMAKRLEEKLHKRYIYVQNGAQHQ